MLAKRWREHGDREAAHKLVASHLCGPWPRSRWFIVDQVRQRPMENLAVENRIGAKIGRNHVVPFMRGTPQFPQEALGGLDLARTALADNAERLAYHSDKDTSKDDASSVGELLQAGVLKGQIVRFLHKHKDDLG